MTTIVISAIGKGILMGFATATLADHEPYWHQVLLVIISATGTAIALITSAIITRRGQQTIREGVETLKEQERRNVELRTDLTHLRTADRTERVTGERHTDADVGTRPGDGPDGLPQRPGEPGQS